MSPFTDRKQSDFITSFAFTAEDFKKISRVLHEEAGIFLSDAKAPLVYSRLTKRLRALGLESFRDYCALVVSEEGVDERQQMIAAMTTNVTKFFREPHHFDHFKTLVAMKAPLLRAGGRMRVWSSACSNGQEPYSIAMTILSVMPDAPDFDIRVLATDIDPNMVSAGIAGEYNDEAVSAVPPDFLQKWFVRKAGVGDVWRVDEKLSSLVAFRELNLIGPWPMKGRFDAIFCRNVAIYFEEKTQQDLWSRFVPKLTPEGVLYIGHSERVSGPATDCFFSEGVTTYRMKGRSA